jgi:hypothetical protein
MGTQAKSVFTELMNQNKREMKLIQETSTQINCKQSIKFFHMKTDRFDVFFMPHFAGNLHISETFKSDFLNFKDNCCSYINKAIG